MRSPEGKDTTALLDGLTFLLGIPVAILFLTFFHPVIRIGAAGCGLLYLHHFWKTRRAGAFAATIQGASRTEIGVVLTLGLLAILITGFGAVFAPTVDMAKFSMVFHQLLENPWPVVHTDCSIAGRPCDVFLRYGLGFFLTPALAGKWIPFVRTDVWILVFHGLTYAVIFLTLARVLKSVRFALLCVALLFSFGDLDTPYQIMKLGWGRIFAHNDAALGPALEYFTPGNLMTWMPGQAIPAFYSGLFYLVAIRSKKISLAQMAWSLFIVAAWSPLVAIGFGLLAADYLIRCRPPLFPTGARAPWDILTGGAILGTVILAIYYGTDTGDIPREFGIPKNYLLFLALNVLPCFGMLMVGYRKETWKAVAPIAAFLCVLPLFRLGAYNDLGRYGSAPLLFVLKVVFLERLFTAGKRLPHFVVLVVFVLSLMDGANALLVPQNQMSKRAMKTFDEKHVLIDWWFSIGSWASKQYFAKCRPSAFPISCQH